MACEIHTGVNDVFTKNQIHHILKRSLGVTTFQLIACDKRPAVIGMAGFLGDHFRVTLHVKANGFVEKIKLFVKCVPVCNAPKAEFINKNGYYKREMMAFKLFEEMHGAEGPNPWCAKAYLYNEGILVMPDLAVEGYRTFMNHEVLDLKHTLLTTASIARFNASFANYVTRRMLNDKSFDFNREYRNVLTEPTFCDSPWLRAAAKLTVNLLKAFSDKFDQYPRDLEPTLVKQFVYTCATLREYEGTLNVLLHKDLWVNNIMFKYNGDVPINALLIDFQCLRLGPPAFDLMVFLYLTTLRKFRERHEQEIFRHYFTIFSETVDDDTKNRLKELNYNFEVFVDWCERSRMFAILGAIGFFPYVLMDPKTAQKTFDDPDTYVKYCDEDRTEPVLAYCRESKVYMERQLEVNEEFVERYVLKQL
ncbi:unnamed protein product [Parnassius apollo]|uniref:(apollo) hypothetical protein n=1 Tax=Parnassius apollo TaxID=110799 RepID=A0A8S3Y1G4_PARAO|nr:unnamed protein product [Parnassius apollo]